MPATKHRATHLAVRLVQPALRLSATKPTLLAEPVVFLVSPQGCEPLAITPYDLRVGAPVWVSARAIAARVRAL